MEKLDVLEKQKFIFGSLFLLANKLQVIGDKYLGIDDMTVKQWFLTAMISQFHDTAPTLGEVAELMGSSHQNVKQLALKLEKKGLLRIEKDEKDGRVIRLRLTEKSNSFWEGREEKDNAFLEELFKDFAGEELNIIYGGFNKLFDGLERISNSKVMEG